MTKKVLEFKLEYGKEEITPYAGLGLYGELYKSIGIQKSVEQLFPEPGSGRGRKANEYIQPLVMMFIGGGKYLEDIRKIGADSGLQKICGIAGIPSSDAIGSWLKRDSWKKVERLDKIRQDLAGRILKRARQEEYTLDIDAMEIEADKYNAVYTYKGRKGYMPLLGFIAELDLCVGQEFRAGNISPQERNYEFTKGIVSWVKTLGKKVGFFRSDSAGYQAELVNYLNGEGVRYTITADQDVAVKELIKRIPAGSWQKVRKGNGLESDRVYAEIIHTMQRTDHSFRLVVQRWLNPQQDLFENTEKYCYHVIATNFTEEEKNGQEVIWWHNGRSNSENYNRELKQGFNLDYLPCGELEANAVWFALGVLAYNIFIASKFYLFPNSWLKKTISTVRWQFIQLAGRIIHHGRALILRICSALRETYDIYEKARGLCYEMQFNY